MYAEYGCYKKCESRRIFPDTPISLRNLHNLQRSEKATSEMFCLSKRTRIRHVLRKNWSQLVLDWRCLQENRWFDIHRKWACRCHKYGMWQHCHIYIRIRHLWFRNCATRIVKQERILWTGTFMGCMLEKSTPHMVSLAMKLDCSPVDAWTLTITCMLLWRKSPVKLRSTITWRQGWCAVCCECNRDDWALFSLRR
jgi:hypothetical protein